MTFSMLWIHGDAIIGAAEGAVTMRKNAPSGVTALGQSDTFPDFSVREGALKVATLDPHVMVTGAGDGAAVVESMEMLELALRGGCSPVHAISILIQSGCTRNSDLLVGFYEQGRPVIVEIRPDGTAVRHAGRAAVVVGSMPTTMRGDLVRGALDIDQQAPAEDALTALQAVAHLAMALEPSLLRNGIGGMVCGAVLRETGFSSQHRTFWILTGDKAFELGSAPGGSGGDVSGVVFSAAEENIHYVRSSFYSEPFSEAIFVGVPCRLDDEAVFAWADRVRPSFYEPDVLVFLNMQRKVACVIKHAGEPTCPVKVTREPFGMAVAEFNRTILDRLIRNGVELGVVVHWYQWWQR